MPRERITRRQKNMSQMIRERKENQAAILKLSKNTKKYGQKP